MLFDTSKGFGNSIHGLNTPYQNINNYSKQTKILYDSVESSRKDRAFKDMVTMNRDKNNYSMVSRSKNIEKSEQKNVQNNLYELENNHTHSAIESSKGNKADAKEGAETKKNDVDKEKEEIEKTLEIALKKRNIKHRSSNNEIEVNVETGVENDGIVEKKILFDRVNQRTQEEYSLEVKLASDTKFDRVNQQKREEIDMEQKEDSLEVKLASDTKIDSTNVAKDNNLALIEMQIDDIMPKKKGLAGSTEKLSDGIQNTSLLEESESESKFDNIKLDALKLKDSQSSLQHTDHKSNIKSKNENVVENFNYDNNDENILSDTKQNMIAKMTSNFEKSTGKIVEFMKSRGNNEIVQQAKLILQGKQRGEIKIVLSPREFGEVKMSFNIDNDKIVGKIIVSSELVKEAIQKNMDNLARQFNFEGYEVEGFFVLVDSNTSEKNNEGQFKNKLDNGNNAKQLTDLSDDMILQKYIGANSEIIDFVA